ncbi:hypothetical protein FBU59_002985 [Linderina macrospora]|uniref:Uncharacterized protein n=1 Tax=Linderina macrospora TaxID=4868 RepID=A0ACC1J9S5_9FUNG|nr:hypothetical protein FBU59_002985 [Linderina macrospora]
MSSLLMLGDFQQNLACPNATQSRKQQYVVRTSHAKHPSLQAPYSTDRGARRSAGSSRSSDDSSSDRTACNSGFSPTGTAFGESSDESAAREQSPSIPLIQQQRQAMRSASGASDSSSVADPVIMSYGEPTPMFTDADASNLSAYISMDGDQEMQEREYMPLCNLLTNAFHNSTKGGDVVLNSASSQDNPVSSAPTAAGHSNGTMAAAGAGASEGEVGVPGDQPMFQLAMSGGFAAGDVTFLNDLIGIPGDQTHHDIFGGASEPLSKGAVSDLPSDAAVDSGNGEGSTHGRDEAESGSGSSLAFVSVPSSSPSQDIDLLRLMQASMSARDMGDKQGLLNAAAAVSAALTSGPNGIGTPMSEEHLSQSSHILAQMLSPPEYLASAKSALKTSPATAGLSTAHHSLASPIVFNTSALFGDAKPSYFLDGSHGGY